MRFTRWLAGGWIGIRIPRHSTFLPDSSGGWLVAHSIVVLLRSVGFDGVRYLVLS